MFRMLFLSFSSTLIPCLAIVARYSEVAPKVLVPFFQPIMACACTFSRALCRLHVITLSFDWFTGLSLSILIGQSNYFGFGFTILV